MTIKENNTSSLTLDQALINILCHINVLDAEEKPLLKCLGQVLAEDIYSDYNLPLTDTAGPDGYAVRAVDVIDANKIHPVILEIVDTVRAGRLSKTEVKTGTAIRIMTGSVMPEGADCVIRFEDTDEPGNKNGPNTASPTQVKIYVSAIPGANIRKAAHQVRKGAVILKKGAIIGPTQIAALAAIGRIKIKVIRKPVIAVITTGDELIQLGEPLSAGKAYDCNAMAIAAMTEHYGGIPLMLGIGRDNVPSITSKIQKGLGADAIVTSGGVSKGDYDLVRLILGTVGKVVFSRIKMGPGASFAFGLANKPSNNEEQISVPVFALSGPPSGCVINFETLVRPGLLKMKGIMSLEHPVIEAVSDDIVSGRNTMATAKWTDLEKDDGGYRVKLNKIEGLMPSMAAANSLTIIPEGTEVRTGNRIRVLPLDWLQ